MQKYFLSKEEFLKKEIVSHSHHICDVMRMKINDEIIISVEGKPYIVNLSFISSEKCLFENEIMINEITELPVHVDLAQGYAKGEKMEYIIQKATELGVNGIYPIVMKRSIVKIEENKKASKLDRMNKIALEASRQSHRNIPPQIYPLFSLKEIDFSQYDKIIIAYEENAHNNELCEFKRTLKALKENASVLLIVGPEGGIDASEIAFLKEKGAISCSLGPRILRTETASLYMLSAISYEMELKV